DCVVEGGTLPGFIDFRGTGIGIYSMGVSASGLLYVQDFEYPKVHRIDQNGVLTQDVVPGLRVSYPSASLVAIGDDLVIGGIVGLFSPATSEIYAWTAQSGTTQTLYSELTSYSLICHTAADLTLAGIIYSNQMGELRKVTSASTTATYGA